jgi:hypothetical protein
VKRSKLETLADEVHEDHCLRLDIPWGTRLVPRPFKRRPRPKTAIIAHAANARVGVKEIISRAIASEKEQCENTGPTT